MRTSVNRHPAPSVCTGFRTHLPRPSLDLDKPIQDGPRVQSKSSHIPLKDTAQNSKSNSGNYGKQARAVETLQTRQLRSDLQGDEGRRVGLCRRPSSQLCGPLPFPGSRIACCCGLFFPGAFQWETKPAVRPASQVQVPQRRFHPTSKEEAT